MISLRNRREISCRFHSFPRSAWECSPGRSASSSERHGLAPRRRRASKTAFPRRTVGTSECPDMNSLIRAGRRRSTLLIVLALAAFEGCAASSSTIQPTSKAPDLMNVSSVAPAINAELASKRATPPDRAVTPAAIERIDPPERSPLLPADLGRRPVEDRAGLMGPTPAVTPNAAEIPPTIPQSAAPYPIDLSTALRLADGQNPTIGEARVLILGALAQRQAARVLLLPTLNAGTNYHDHNGPLLRSAGAILNNSLQSLYVGGGAGAYGSSPPLIPMVNIFSPLTDAIFEPLAAQQRVDNAKSTASDTANKVLLEVASLYIDLIGAETILEAWRASAAESDRLAKIVADYAATGQGRASDANRADADRRFFQADIQKAEERVAVASARLAQRLNLDPSAQLKPLSGPLQPVELINPDTPVEELIRSALQLRPDLAAREALVAQAEYRVKQEKARPLLPTLWVSFSAGAMGGGSNATNEPLGSFASRTDFDVRAFWTVLNFGAGNASLIKQRKTQEGQAIADRVRVMNQIRAEVTSARAESLALRSQVVNARIEFESSERGFSLDQTRLRESLARPIEALDSLRLLAEARVALIEAITRANRTQFALFVSLGAPPPLNSPVP
jgi:outer membrane protein TolC